MASQHTPGPWTIREGSFIDGQGFACLANVRAAHVPHEHEAIANARLIAAAPDLLAACQAVLDEFPAFDSKRIESVKRICRAAIAKAEGRS